MTSPKISLLFLWFVVFTVSLAGCSVSQNNADLIRLGQLKDQAFAGDTESQYQLGVHYTTSTQWRWDKARGYGWFREAADGGHADAQYMVGMCYLLGEGVAQDGTVAVTWLAKAAQKGHRRSQYQLGQLYLDGNGTGKDLLWGRYWLEQAAWAGHPHARLVLAALFSKGVGGQKNSAAAWAWLVRAKRSGIDEANAALEKMTSALSETEKQRGRHLLKTAAKTDHTGLYLIPKIRYLQAKLNQIGFSAGVEDGSRGVQTRSAVQQYLLKKELPRETSIDQLIASLRGSH